MVSSTTEITANEGLGVAEWGSRLSLRPISFFQNSSCSNFRLRLISLFRLGGCENVVSPRQTAIYAMSPSDHDIENGAQWHRPRPFLVCFSSPNHYSSCSRLQACGLNGIGLGLLVAPVSFLFVISQICL